MGGAFIIYEFLFKAKRVLHTVHVQRHPKNVSSSIRL